ncbi:MAG: ABC-F family ATP-binding cassette domain-containing protein [Candidatus Cloacimonadales bacterium]
MSEISVNNISKIFTYEYILDDVTFQVGKGERVGLIGRNGTGKTTLFNIITGREDKSGDLGKVVIRKGAKIGRLDQIPIYPEEITPRQILRQPFVKLLQKQKQLQQLEKRLEVEYKDQNLLQEYEILQDRYESAGGYEMETKIKWVCVGLNISSDLLDKSFNHLSGGEKTRITLGKILLSDPDILLLDEPTNHLDLQSVEWLENFLQKFSGAALIITHDRYFIDRVINKILVLENGKVTKFNTNYTNYALEMRNRQVAAENEYGNLQKEIRRKRKQLKQSIERNSKNHSAFMSARIRELSAELDEMRKIKKPSSSKKMGLQLQAIAKSSKIVLRLEKVNFAYGDNLILKDLDLFVKKGEKVAIVGANGSGKSTLIKLMMEQINRGSGLLAASGEVYVGAGIEVGYLDQELLFPDPQLTVLEELSRALDLDWGAARSILARFLFYSDDIDKKIEIISGGEKTRLKLAILMNQNLNTLVLDEPTNHLDIPSRELLEEVISNFNGSVIIISHDRYFINQVVDKIAYLNAGSIKTYAGNYDFYKAELDIDSRQKEEIITDEKQAYHVQKQARNQAQRRREKLENLEAEMAGLESKIQEKSEAMYDYPTDYQKLRELQSEIDALQQQLDELLENWMELQ